MRCAIVQPSYLPWRGYFHLLQKSDVFVFYDDVQYDKHGWRNRNQIKTVQGLLWLTVPVAARGNVVHGTPINEVRIADHRWPSKHLAAIEQSYARAPHVQRCLELIEPHLNAGHELLADLTIDLTKAVANELGIAPSFVRSSQLTAGGDRTERLVAVLREVGATHYVSGPSARAYLDEELLARAGISMEYMTYDYPPYEQLHPPYTPNVSIIDLLAVAGPEAGGLIWGRGS